MSPTIQQGITQTFYGRVKKHAAPRGIDVAVSREHLQELFDAQGGRCVYTGIELVSLGNSNWNFSLDRIDSDLPYEEGNLQFVYKPINSMKWTVPDDVFLLAVKSIVENEPVPVNMPEYIHGVSRRSTFKGVGPITGEFFNKVRRNAARRDIPFDLDIDYVYGLFVEQMGLCAYTSWPIKFPDLSMKRGGDASIDRIDSSLGYIEGNIIIVHKNINYMKGSMTEDEFFQIVTEIYNWSIILGQPNKIINKEGVLFFV